MIGARGVPATFGGVEHHVEELGSRLAQRGHEVVVYSRRGYADPPISRYRGMQVVALPTVGTKHLDAIVQSTLATLDAVRRGFDIVHYHAIGPGIPAFLPRYLSPIKVALTVHGLDAQRAKWGRGARAVLSTADWLSARVPDATIVVSRDLARHYESVHGRETEYIPNGVDEPMPAALDEIGRRWGLTRGSYLLFVGRLVPEKAPDLLLRSFRRMTSRLALVIAGGSSFTDEYVRALTRAADADERVLLPGYVYGDTLNELYANAAAFVLPSTLEGLPLTLLEAVSFGIPVVVSDIPPNLEVVGSEGPGHRVFAAGSEDGLLAALQRVTHDAAQEEEGASSLRREILERYRWEDAVEATETVYRRVLHSGRTDIRRR
jgi:glycosyltransferase involved in cell wall biosynthesis